MSNQQDKKADLSEVSIYQITIQGHFDPQWSEWFGGLEVRLEDNGDTVLTGPVIDQAALYGLLRKVRDLGGPLLSVHQVKDKSNEGIKGNVNQNVER